MQNTPIVVINMDKSVERLDKIKKNLDDLDLEFERFSAINGRQLQNTEIEKSTSLLCRNLLCSKAVVGCALSHITVWKNFLKADAEIMCVIEDDCELTQDFKTFLNDIYAIQSKTEFDILSLYCNGICNIGQPIQVGNYKFIKNPLFPLATMCYFITRKGAEKALEILGEKINYMVDFSLAMGRVLNNINYVVLVSPKIVKSTLAKSTINNDNKKGMCMHLLGDNKVKWYLNIPLLTIGMKYEISIYTTILILLLLVSLYKNCLVLTTIIIVELVLLNI